MLKAFIFTLIAYSAVQMPANAQSDNIFHLVKAKIINHTLAKQFPISKSFQGQSATFSQPKIIIDVLDQSIKLQVTASATDANADQELVTTLIFIGDMTYDNISESYIFEKLQLDSFKVEQDSVADSQQIIKAIKQSLINDFEDIVLVNLGEISGLVPTRPADKIEISKQQLRFIWQ